MFHNSTTLRHQFRATPMNFGERRLVHNKFTEVLGTVWGGIASGGKKLGAVGKVVFWPAKLSVTPFLWAMKKGWQGLSTAVDYGRQGTFAAYETARSAAVDMVGKPLYTLARTPFVDVWMNLVGNTREIFKGLMRLPMNILRTPGAVVQSTRESFSNLFKSTKNLLTFQGDFWNSVKSVSWRHPINSTRNIIGSALGGVGDVLAPSAARAHIKACFETPYNVGKNIVEAKTQYFKAMPESFRQFRTGIQSTISAPSRGRQAGIDWKERRRQLEEKEKAAGKEEEKKGLKKEVEKGKAKEKKAA